MNNESWLKRLTEILKISRRHGWFIIHERLSTQTLSINWLPKCWLLTTPKGLYRLIGLGNQNMFCSKSYFSRFHGSNLFHLLCKKIYINIFFCCAVIFSPSGQCWLSLLNQRIKKKPQNNILSVVCDKKQLKLRQKKYLSKK